MFLQLFIVRQIYGAKRWIAALQKMSERYNVEVNATCLTKHHLKGGSSLRDLKYLRIFKFLFI